jgi:hypothetical protein
VPGAAGARAIRVRRRQLHPYPNQHQRGDEAERQRDGDETCHRDRPDLLSLSSVISPSGGNTTEFGMPQFELDTPQRNAAMRLRRPRTIQTDPAMIARR